MNKRTAAVVSLIFCLLLALVRIEDLLLFSDVATGFPLWGESWYRYLAAAAAALVLYLLSRKASLRPVAFKRRRRALGGAMLLTAALMLETGVSTLLVLPDGFAGLRGALLLVSGAWFGLFGIWAFFPPSVQAPPAVLSLAGLAAPVWVAVERFAIRPSSLARTGHVLGVLSVLAALCCIDSLLKMVFAPNAPFGRRMAFTGMLAFLLSSCVELPGTLFSVLAGGGSLLDLALSGCWAGVGLCGLVCALYAYGEDRKDLPLLRIPGDAG